MQVWQQQAVERGPVYHWALGPLELWIHRAGADELHVATRRGEEGDEATAQAAPLTVVDGPLPELEWTRWIVRAGASVRLLPVMPNRAVVARPESPLRLPTGAAARFFVSVPVWVRVVSEDESSVTLTEVPSTVLSNIWFGDTMQGELCYSLATTARREMEQTVLRPHRAVCPVRLANDSLEELAIQRIRVEVAQLTVFDAGTRLWTNQVNVTYKGAEAGSQLELVAGPPAEATGEATVVGEARETPRRRVWARAFGALGSMF